MAETYKNNHYISLPWIAILAPNKKEFREILLNVNDGCNNYMMIDGKESLIGLEFKGIIFGKGWDLLNVNPIDIIHRVRT